jgi:hypothetical protein
MASVSFAATPVAFKSVTVNGSGFTASTAYVCTVTDPTGGKTQIGVTSNGSGNFSFTYVPQANGSVTVDVRPQTEFMGMTSAAATTGSTTLTRGYQ